MKKTLLTGLVLFFLSSALLAQESITAKADKIELTYKNENSKYRLKQSETSIICGYYSTEDKNFYTCTGNKLVTVTDLSKLKDGSGCCERISLSTGTFRLSGMATLLEKGKVRIENGDESYLIYNSEELEQLLNTKAAKPLNISAKIKL